MGSSPFTRTTFTGHILFFTGHIPGPLRPQGPFQFCIRKIPAPGGPLMRTGAYPFFLRGISPKPLRRSSRFPTLPGKVPRPRRCSDEHWGISPRPLRLLRKRGFLNPSHFVTAPFRGMPARQTSPGVFAAHSLRKFADAPPLSGETRLWPDKRPMLPTCSSRLCERWRPSI